MHGKHSLSSASNFTTSSADSNTPLIPETNTKTDMDEKHNNSESQRALNTDYGVKEITIFIQDNKGTGKRNEQREVAFAERVKEINFECVVTKQDAELRDATEAHPLAINKKKDATITKDEYSEEISILKKDIEKHKICWKWIFVSFIIVNLLMLLFIYLVLKAARSNEDKSFYDPYFEDYLADKMISSKDFRIKINQTVFCVTCRYSVGDESLWYRNSNGECCARDIVSVFDIFKEILRNKTDNLKERVRELEVFRENLNVLGSSTNDSEHVTIIQKTSSSVSNELLQELFSRKKSAVHLRDSGAYKTVGNEYHILWSRTDTTRRNEDMLENGSTVSIAADGFYFLYCKIMFFKYRTPNDTLHEPLTYQIRRKRHGTAFLLEETRQKWEQVGKTMEFQSSIQMVYKFDAGDMIYVSFPSNQVQSFIQSSHASHSLGLFEL